VSLALFPQHISERLGETLADILRPTNGSRNAMVYIDFKNISELLKRSGHDPLEMNFFKVIQEKLKEAGLNIIEIYFEILILRYL
jgi:hypothetical protein